MNLDEGIPLGDDEPDEIAQHPTLEEIAKEAKSALPPDPSPDRAVEAPVKAQEGTK
jgi:hypothetical protein